MPNSQEKSTKKSKPKRVKNLVDLYEYADNQGYGIYDYGLHGNLATMSIQDTDGQCYVAVDSGKLNTASEKFCKILHEIGHCDTGSFYNQYAVCDIRKQHENIADKRAIELAIPREDFVGALDDGYRDVWSLADYFGVTPEFICKTYCWYKYGSLNSELHFE